MPYIIIYSAGSSKSKLEILLEIETIWVNQRQIVELYNKSKSTICGHIKHIFEEAELQREAVVRKFRTTASNGMNFEIVHLRRF